MERGRSALGERLVEFLNRIELLAVVGPQVEVADDLHRPVRKQREDVLLDERLADSFELSELELRAEVVEDCVAVRRFFGDITEMADRVLVGRRADEDIPDVLGIDLGVLAKIDVDLPVKRIDEEIKDLVFGEFTGCLVWSHHPTKQPVHLTGFVKYWDWVGG